MYPFLIDQSAQGSVFQYGKSQHLAVDTEVHWFNVVEMLLLVYEKCSWKLIQYFSNSELWKFKNSVPKTPAVKLKVNIDPLGSVSLGLWTLTCGGAILTSPPGRLWKSLCFKWQSPDSYHTGEFYRSNTYKNYIPNINQISLPKWSEWQSILQHLPSLSRVKCARCASQGLADSSQALGL